MSRCDANPTNLDDPNASLRTREQTAALLESEDPETLWYDYGIIPGIKVYHLHHFRAFNTFSLPCRSRS